MLITDMNNEKLFGLKFLPCVNKANRHNLPPETVNECIIKAAHIVLSQPINYVLPPPKTKQELSNEDRIAEQLRDYIRQQIDSMTLEDLRFVISHAEEEHHQ